MDYKHISKFLSLVLRHKPEEIGLHVDAEGWANVQELLEKLESRGMHIDFAMLEHLVTTNDKQRFILNETGDKIRANQGHSIAVDLKLQPQQPPEVLYHGTVAAFLPNILEGGIQKMSRQQVHLSKDVETASKVGQRRGKPIILKVMALEMHQEGYPFYLSDNGVWLTDFVPPKYLTQNKH